MNSLQSSDKKLDCKGRACAKCGYCRDWCWRPKADTNDPKDYKKREDATCTDGYDGRGYDGDGRGYDGRYYHGYGRRRRLCECDDNRW